MVHLALEPADPRCMPWMWQGICGQTVKVSHKEHVWHICLFQQDRSHWMDIALNEVIAWTLRILQCLLELQATWITWSGGPVDMYLWVHSFGRGMGCTLSRCWIPAKKGFMSLISIPDDGGRYCLWIVTSSFSTCAQLKTWVLKTLPFVLLVLFLFWSVEFRKDYDNQLFYMCAGGLNKEDWIHGCIIFFEVGWWHNTSCSKECSQYKIWGKPSCLR